MCVQGFVIDLLYPFVSLLYPKGIRRFGKLSAKASVLEIVFDF